jgi:hypothetical protein
LNKTFVMRAVVALLKVRVAVALACGPFVACFFVHIWRAFFRDVALPRPLSLTLALPAAPFPITSTTSRIFLLSVQVEAQRSPVSVWPAPCICSCVLVHALAPLLLFLCASFTLWGLAVWGCVLFLVFMCVSVRVFMCVCACMFLCDLAVCI